MSEERTKLEVIAPSVEEAIEKGLQILGLTQADIDVEILDEGKKGPVGPWHPTGEGCFEG